MTRRPSAILANDGLLLLTAAIWGFAFVAQRVGMEHVGPFTFNAVRFALGSLSLVPLALWRRLTLRRDDGIAAGEPGTRSPMRILPCGILAGSVLFLAASLQQVGMIWTGAGKAGFITGLYVVLVPLAGLFRGEKPGGTGWCGAVLAAIGLFLLSVTRTFAVERGDLILVAGALFWTAHVRIIARLAPRTEPVALSAVQFGTCAVLSGIVAALAEPWNAAAVLDAAWPILYGGLLSVGVAYTLQVVAQRKAPPAHAAILLSLESFFAAVGGWALLGERLGARGLLGCALMLAGMLCAQLPAALGPQARQTP